MCPRTEFTEPMLPKHRAVRADTVPLCCLGQGVLLSLCSMSLVAQNGLRQSPCLLVEKKASTIITLGDISLHGRRGLIGMCFVSHSESKAILTPPDWCQLFPSASLTTLSSRIIFIVICL